MIEQFSLSETLKENQYITHLNMCLDINKHGPTQHQNPNVKEYIKRRALSCLLFPMYPLLCCKKSEC